MTRAGLLFCFSPRLGNSGFPQNDLGSRASSGLSPESSVLPAQLGSWWGWAAGGSCAGVWRREPPASALPLHLSSGVSTSSLSDGILVIHVSPEDNKQKVMEGHQPLRVKGHQTPGLQP